MRIAVLSRPLSLLILLLCACVPGDPDRVRAAAQALDGGAGAPTLSVPATNYTGTPLPVTVTGGPGYIKDWVGIYKPGAADDAMLNWVYLSDSRTTFPPPGTTSATIHFSGLSAGSYELRFFENETYTLLATASATLVPPPPPPPPPPVTLVAAPDTVARGGTVTVTISKAQGGAVYMRRVGAVNGLDYQYFTGGKSPPPAGVYATAVSFTAPDLDVAVEFHAYDSTQGWIKSNIVRVGSGVPPTLSPSPLNAMSGENITVALTGGTLNDLDWVGLFATGASNFSPVSWQRVPYTALSASFLFRAPSTSGTFEFRWFQNESYVLITTSPPVTVTAPPPSPVAVSPAAVARGGTVTVTVTGGPGDATDWLTLSNASDDRVGILDWKYLNGARTPPAMGLRNATVSFTVPATAAVGSYTLRYLAHDGFTRIGTATLQVN